MHEHTPHQAMTEIALALSMAFFCLMVLSLVAVGVPNSQVQTPVQMPFDTPMMQLNDSPLRDTLTTDTEGRWVIYFHQAFYDLELKVLDPAELVQGRLLLAVAPDLDLQQLLAAQAQINSPDVSITLLDDAWISRLEELQ